MKRLKETTELKKLDPIWSRIRQEAHEIIERDPALSSFIYAAVLHHETLEEVIIHRVAARLNHPDMPSELIRQAYQDALEDNHDLSATFRSDIAAVCDRDPATNRAIEPVLYYKGFHALQSYRLANWLWHNERKDFALYIQSRCSSKLQVDIHPAAKFGRGIFLDHATGFVVGETAIVDDDCSFLHNVTLGGTGKEHFDRHPKIQRGVLVGVGAKILGNIVIGHCARIAAGSVVLKNVPPCTTVAGVPAEIVGDAGCAEPARAMDQMLSKP